jgi:hypothetical protein
MKKCILVIALVFSHLLFFCGSINAQSTALEQGSDTIISVVGYFCKNDTMTFRKQYLKQKIEGNDTTLINNHVEEFMIVVTDSTSKGYRMEYIPISYEHGVEGDTITSRVMDEIWEATKDLHCIFATDEFGQLQHIENWREIRDVMKKTIPQVLDNLKPSNNSIVSRQRLESMMLVNYSSEDKVKEAYDELSMLFGVHGHSYYIGQKEGDYINNGYPQHIISKVGYTEQEEEGDMEGDYTIMVNSVTTMPAEDAVETIINSAALIFNDNMIDIFNKKKDEVYGVIKDALKDKKLTVTEDEYYDFFYNGWPKLCYKGKNMGVDSDKNVEMKLIEWTSRHWNIYEAEEEDDSHNL